MKGFYIYIFISIICFLSSCNQDKLIEKKVNLRNSELENFEWLIGTWSSVSEKFHYQETWIKTNDFLLSGSAFMLSKTDTVFSEKLQIIFLDKDIYYIATIGNQNNGLPVRFKLTKNERGLHIFENQLHDFPQKIIYFMKSKYILFASASGVENGVFRKEDFYLKKQ